MAGEKAHKALALSFQAFVSDYKGRKKQSILGYLGRSPFLLPGYRPSPDQGMCLVPRLVQNSGNFCCCCCVCNVSAGTVWGLE